MLQTLGTGLSLVPRAGADHLPVQREGARRRCSGTPGVQMALPWSSSLDVSLRRQPRLQPARRVPGRHAVNLNAVDLGAAYLPENQDPTQAPARCPARRRCRQPAAAVSGATGHQPEHDRVLRHVPLDPDVVQPPVPRRVLVRRQLHAGAARSTATRDCTQRLQHNAGRQRTRSAPTRRHYEDAEQEPRRPPHVMQGNCGVGPAGPRGRRAARCARSATWSTTGSCRASSRPSSGTHYDLSYTLPEQRRRREPDGLARLRRARSSTSAIRARAARRTSTRSSTRRRWPVRPTAASAWSRAATCCAAARITTVDLALARNIRLGGGRQVQLRLDAFNAFNIVDLHRPSGAGAVQQPDRPDAPQLPDPGGRLGRSDPADAAQRRLRRGDGRADAAATCS